MCYLLVFLERWSGVARHCAAKSATARNATAFMSDCGVKECTTDPASAFPMTYWLLSSKLNKLGRYKL